MGNMRKKVRLSLFLILASLLLFSSIAACSDAHQKTQISPSSPTTGSTTAPTVTGAGTPAIPAQDHPGPGPITTSSPTATTTSIATTTTTSIATTTATPTGTATLPPTPQPVSTPPPSPSGPSSKPVLAFYYPWYSTSTWCACQMSDLPTTQYNSSDDATIMRQLNWATNAGITGFISSWWGAGDQTDKNFVKLLSHSATLQSQTQYNFTSSIYFETDAPTLQGSANTVSALTYILNQYGNNPHFFHWQGHPVIFFWDPLGNGRTLSYWAAIRQQVDPNHQMLWSAEGVSNSLLSVFDGLHLFSGGYWGLQSNTMPAVDQGFRTQIDAYNKANGTQKIWAAGVIPGYNDTLVPGRVGTYIVPRNNGATYTSSWQAAISSNPDWITITSFNEWFEGAQIEPSVTYGTQYLTLTQQFTSQW